MVNNINYVYIKSFYRNFHMSLKSQCFWKTINKVLNRDVSITKEMKFLKIYPSQNVFFKNYNREIFKNYLNNKEIYKYQYDALVTNTNKIFKTFRHPAYIFEKDGSIYGIFRTSQTEGGVRLPLTLEDIITATKASYLNADIVEFREFLGRYYYPVVYELGPKETIKVYFFKSVNAMSPKDLQDFQEFYIKNIDKFKVFNANMFFNPNPILEKIKLANQEEKKLNEIKNDELGNNQL